MLTKDSAARANANANASLAVGAHLVAFLGFRGALHLEHASRFNLLGEGRIASALSAGYQVGRLLLGKLAQCLGLGDQCSAGIRLTASGHATLRLLLVCGRRSQAGHGRPGGQQSGGDGACVQGEGMEAMNFVRMLFLVLFIAAVTSGSAWAEVWSRTYNLSLPLPETQTRAALRAEAIQSARDLASAEFGTVVLKQVTLAQGGLSERVRTVSAGLTKVRVASESLRQSSDGVVLVDYRLNVEVDGSELDRQVRLMSANAERDQALRSSQRENEVLRAQNNALQKQGSESPKGKVMAEAIGVAAGGGSAGRGAPVTMKLAPAALLAAANQDPEGAELLGRFDALVMQPLLAAPLNFAVKSVDVRGDGIAVSFSGTIQGWHGVMRDATRGFVVPQKVGVSGVERCAVSLSGSSMLDAALRNEALVLDLQIGSQRQYWIMGEYKGSGAGFCVHGEVQSVMSVPMAKAKDVEKIEARVARASALPSGWRERARRDLAMPRF